MNRDGFCRERNVRIRATAPASDVPLGVPPRWAPGCPATADYPLLSEVLRSPLELAAVSARLETANPHHAASKVRGACGTIAVTRVLSRMASWAP